MNKIGVIGCGTVGGAIIQALKKSENIKLYMSDKYKSGAEYLSVSSLSICDMVFIAVPTPFDENTGGVDLEPILSTTRELAKSGFSGILVIKSTVPPGTSEMISKEMPNIKVVFNPEFLREKTAVYDFYNQKNIVFGVDENFNANGGENANLLEYIFSKIINDYKEAIVTFTDYKTAELIKYSQNVMFSSRIAICNIIYDACQKFSVDYDIVKELAFYNQSLIGENIVEVPGPDGMRGFGGKCLIWGTEIITTSEVKKIEDIRVGDFVYSGDSYTRVTGISNRTILDSVKINSRGRNIRGSKDHIHFVYNKSDKCLEEKLLKDISINDWIYLPKINYYGVEQINLGERPARVKNWRSVVNINKNISRLFGLYCAEGCSGIYEHKANDRKNSKKEYTVIWTFGHDEKYLAEEVCEILFNEFAIIARPKLVIAKKATFGVSKTWNVRTRTRFLYTLFSKANLGHNAHTKNTILINKEFVKDFISGWLDGDGTFDHSNNTISGFSRSVELINKIDSMLLSVGICSSITRNGQQINISMRDDVAKVLDWSNHNKFNKSGVYITDIRYNSPNMRQIKDGWITKVKNIEYIKEPIKVCSIETENHKYVANNILTHNCLPKDTAGFNSFFNSKVLEEILEYNKKLGRKIE